MLEIGSIVDGKYKVLNKIGQGGMSIVYLAMNERANKQWAIKEIRKDGVSNYEVVKQGLIVETDLLKKLNHPHLPSIIDVIDGDGTFLIVMDYIEGNPLSKVLKHKGAQEQDDVVEWAKQLCDVLGYLHSREKPIVYRDMKPSNVMLKPDGTVTLIDFGTAREYKTASLEDTTCLGTQGYAAPEQFGGQGQTDGRTDIYCLGATMYHLITGHNPAEPPYEMYPIRQWNPQLSSGLEEIIIKCTQKNPNDRYQSCAELMYALEHYKDLENESKKIYTRKWRLFLASAIMCILTLICTVGFKIMMNNEIQSTYDSYLEKGIDAINGSRIDEAFEDFQNAIEIAPENGEAYIRLLGDAILGDDIFTSSESQIIVEILESTESGRETFISRLKEKDKKNYYLLMYNLGNAYYYYYEDSSGKNKAGEYYKKAAEGEGYLDKQQFTRASTLYKICEYQNDIGIVPRDGITKTVKYTQLWEDINKLVDTDYESVADRTLAVKVYASFNDMVTVNKNKLNQEGISDSDILSRYLVVKEKAEKIYELELNDQTLPEVSKENLDNLLESLDFWIGQLENSVNKGITENNNDDKEE
ncbi:MAG: serine/threonine protein kinase [Lachnospiraceae bacterium]|nr:serine/threonine protein kinase [Lachnospiraceae bacterium]